MLVDPFSLWAFDGQPVYWADVSPAAQSTHLDHHLMKIPLPISGLSGTAINAMMSVNKVSFARPSVED